jgi:hypothetical protein
MARREHGPDPLGEDAARPTACSAVVGQAATEPTGAIDLDEHYARHLRESPLAIFLNGCLGHALPQAGLIAYKRYRDGFLADCGNPIDPIEIVLIEQIAMSHLISGYLHVKGTNAASVESAAAYLGAGARLSGELRRTALALQVFRAAARQLNNTSAAARASPADPVLQLEDDSITNRGDSEKGADPRSADDDGPRILPLRRSATS